MQIKSLKELNAEKIKEVVGLLFKSQVSGSQSCEEIHQFITGRFFDAGRYLLVATENDRILATIGAIVAEVERKEIFISALTCEQGYEDCIEPMLQSLLPELSVFGNCTIKLGIKDGQKVPVGFPDKQGFRKSYSLLQMIFAGNLPSEESLANIDLQGLCAANIDQFVTVSNAAFINTANAANITGDDARRLLNTPELFCGLIVHQNIVKGSFELKLVSTTGWIESVGLLPRWQSKGLGSPVVAKLIYRLRHEAARDIKLSVISNNEKAYKLYCKMGFKIDRTLSDWYCRLSGHL
ncbi:MAG: GCN5-related N-acetyltransferase [uncultured bacterium]|nr:MAG: GCN5-related N-acetyltransferase [uncultured bacterium]